MFFNSERQHFFKPLTSKYREQVVQCLCLLYERLYSSNADYGHSLSRDQAIEILEEALVRAPVLELEDGDEDQTRFKNNREQANWILKQLLDYGWLEKQVDGATLQTTYPFTRMGRLFTQPLVESDSTQIRTRHRNTRNTLNALEAFINRGDTYDLIDAFDCSERIITDFTDIIAELEERKRELVREVESQQLVQQASDQFFEFMEKRFQPDVSVRLSADSVEKHRNRIQKAIAKIRHKKTESKREIEQDLRRRFPELVTPGQSVLWLILDTIERRMGNAADIMLPALRRALHSFTKRADIIIRQLSYLTSQKNTDLLQVCNNLQNLDDKDYKLRLNAAADIMASMRLQLVDPGHIRLQERKTAQAVNTAVQEAQALDSSAQREIIIQQLLDQAFNINNQSLRNYVVKSLRDGQRISTSQLPIDSAQDLLAMAHAIEVGSSNINRDGFYFKVEYSERELSSDYFTSPDEFTIELISDAPQTGTPVPQTIAVSTEADK
ncbi:Wadjet anti-phage system protein JetA family protein [Teredinibacter waterburyi]|jgi:hypothetical protein|uniref:Wadjet anti-phage system protein JetA family protein n=1 Tax=Teredinibacter waterburyi TaxID=1500538 RepID=UPI00165F1295|nr:Wadjet anti-phage system protein JetA family protein [Teredinibacter waterburyi]